MRVERCGESISIFMNFAWLHHICCNFHSSPSPSYRWQNIKRTFWQWPCGLTVYSGPQIVKLWKYGSEKVQQSVKISGFHRFNTIYALCRLENAANYAYFWYILISKTLIPWFLWTKFMSAFISCSIINITIRSHELCRINSSCGKRKIEHFPGKLDVQLNF